MLKISLKALTKLLLTNGHMFTIAQCKHENFVGRTMLEFLVGHKYPSTGPHIGLAQDPNDRDALMQARMERRDARVLLHFDADNDTLLSAGANIYTLIRDAKKKAIEQAAEKGELVS